MKNNNRPSPHLKWNNRNDAMKIQAGAGYSIREIERIIVNTVFDKQSFFEQRGPAISIDGELNNRYHYGNNYDLLQFLATSNNERKINLIYIDPPYMTDLDYYSRISVGTASDIRHINRKAFQDTWESGLNAYLDMLYPRFQLMRQVLADNGSIFVHVDWHASHYVKVLLDEIFGRDNFINEIVWCFGGGSSSRKHFQRKHDLIFWYARSSEYTFNPQYRPYTAGTVQRGLTKVKGDRYKLNEEGAVMQDWWADINKILSPTARENLKFPTQKPKELIKRIIRSASQSGDLVADFFGGSGTTAEVCNELGRDWILSDSSKLAMQTSLYRLLKSGSPPFAIVAGENNPGKDGRGELVLKEPIFRKIDKNGCLIEIGIESYLPEKENRPSSQDFASDIEFWELDLDYNGEIFNSHYQVMREKQRFKDEIALNFLVHIPLQESYNIAVKVYDVFATHTMEVLTFEP
jgi:site-specific DNA-methyltransferase (adenine-specific)